MSRLEHLRISKIGLALLIALLIQACNIIFPEAPEENQTLDGPFANLSTADNAKFLAGDIAFNDEVFTSELGLGPLFVANSCASCHAGDGKGHPFTTLVRFGQTAPNTSPDLSIGGPQLQNRALPGYEPERIPEGTPSMKILPPAVTGLGLLAALTDSQILANADPNDDNGDGISGVPSYISPPPYFEKGFVHDLLSGQIIGRFGKKSCSYRSVTTGSERISSGYGNYFRL